MLTTVLWLTLSTAPVSFDLSDLPVDDLTLPELRSEEVRLRRLPGLLAPAISFGGGALLASLGAATWFGLGHTWSSTEAVQVALTLVRGVGGVGMGIGGFFLLIGMTYGIVQTVRLWQEWRRQQAVAQRLAAFTAGELVETGPVASEEVLATYAAQHLALQEARTGRGPWVVMALGAAVLLATGFAATLADNTPFRDWTPYAVGITAGVLGIGGGVCWRLMAGFRDEDLDRRIDTLRREAPLRRLTPPPPPVQATESMRRGGVPIAVSYAWAF